MQRLFRRIAVLAVLAMAIAAFGGLWPVSAAQELTMDLVIDKVDTGTIYTPESDGGFSFSDTIGDWRGGNHAAAAGLERNAVFGDRH